MKKRFAAFAFILVAFQAGMPVTSSQSVSFLVLTQVRRSTTNPGGHAGRFLLNGAADEGSRIVLLAAPGFSRHPHC